MAAIGVDEDDSVVVLDDDDDDDVVITQVKAGDRLPTYSQAGLAEVMRLLADAKAMAAQSEIQMAKMSEEIENMRLEVKLVFTIDFDL